MAKTKEAVAKTEVSVTAMHGDIEIYYQSEPRRHYKLRKGEGIDWVEVPSVSTVNDVLSKDGLSWWGQMIALDAVLALWQFPQGFITMDAQGRLLAHNPDTGGYEVADRDNLKTLLVKQKLSVNHVRDAAGDRGNSVHDALQAWVDEGIVPVPDLYPPAERGYVEGLLKFIADVGEIKQAKSEVMVASYEHGFAGRYDLEGILKDANLVIKRPSPAWDDSPGAKNHHSAKPAQRQVFNGQTLFDLKTSSGVYASHQIQMEGYEIARVEGGLKPSKQKLVIHVTEDGTYCVKDSTADAEAFLNTLALYNSVGRIS